MRCLPRGADWFGGGGVHLHPLSSCSLNLKKGEQSRKESVEEKRVLGERERGEGEGEDVHLSSAWGLLFGHWETGCWSRQMWFESVEPF